MAEDTTRPKRPLWRRLTALEIQNEIFADRDSDQEDFMGEGDDSSDEEETDWNQHRAALQDLGNDEEDPDFAPENDSDNGSDHDSGSSASPDEVEMQAARGIPQIRGRGRARGRGTCTRGRQSTASRGRGRDKTAHQNVCGCGQTVHQLCKRKDRMT